MRYLALYLPNWSLDLAAKKRSIEQEEKKYILLTTTRGGQKIVQRCSSLARRCGIEQGTGLALAQALLPKTYPFTFEPLPDFQMIYKLAVWALRFTPLVGIDQELVSAYKRKFIPDAHPIYTGLLLDVSGTERLHKGIPTLIEKLHRKCAQAKIELCIGAGPTIGSAWALSRCRDLSDEHRLCSWKTLRSALGQLPVQTLRIEDEITIGLEELGIYTISELLKFPTKKLLSRFGVQLIRRLDQAFGGVEEPLRTIHPSQHIDIHKVFEPPLEKKQALQQAVLELFIQLLGRLDKQIKSAATFLLTFETFNAEERISSFQKEISLHTPTTKRSHLCSILSPILESISAPHGICALTIAARDLKRTHYEQENYLHTPLLYAPPYSSDELLNSLVVRLGGERVCGVKLSQSYIPEQSYSFESVRRILKDRGSSFSARTFQDYPPFLFRSPRPIQALALLPDNPPLQITWERKRYRIIGSSGPERISSEWWLTPHHSPEEEREYFKVQDHTGRWLWIFRERRAQNWFVHGMWA